MIYYPIYEEQFDENDTIVDTIIGISIFDESYLCNNWDNTGYTFYTGSGQQIDYIGNNKIKDIDSDFDYVEEYASKTLNGAQEWLIKFAFHDFK